jgi:hypothetical protein
MTTMTSMRDDLEQTIANSVRVTLEKFPDGSELVRGLDDVTTSTIAAAVLEWLAGVPLDGFVAENHAAGHYSRENIAALIADIEDDA